MSAPEETADILALKVQKEKLLRAKIELIKRYGLAYYKPFDKQDAFHRAGLRYKRRMVRSGNRFGKSTLGAAEDCAWLQGERPWYPEGDPARRGGIPQHPVKLLTITQDWDKVHEIWTGQDGEGGKAWKFLPRDLIKKPRRNSMGVIDSIELANKSLWRFDTVKSFKSNPMGSESSDWDAIHVDEPCPEDMWKANSRGLIDRGGSAWFTLTPLAEFWINDYFFPNDTGGAPRDDVWAVSGSTGDNPYLSKEAIAAFERDLTDEEKQCRIHGIPLHLSGLIYKQFRWDRHVMQKLPEGWESWENPPLTWPVCFAIDPHPQTPHAVLFCAVSPQGYRFYYKDIFVHCSIRNLAALIKPCLAGRYLLWGKMDPLGFINDPITETNMAIELEDNGVIVEKATKALEHGILKVQGEFERDPAVLQFSPACRRTLWEIQRYAWDEKENRPVDRDDHMMENLYRMELAEPFYVDPTVKFKPIDDLVIDRTELRLDDISFKD
jgi:hypothetical protein